MLAFMVLAYRWLAPPVGLAPPVARSLRLSLICLLAYLAFQIIPLPRSLVETLSPARSFSPARLSSGLDHSSFSSLSVQPAATFLLLLRVVAYALAFWLARQLSFRFAYRRRLLVMPILAIATMEAIWGIVQVWVGGAHSFAYGSYIAQGSHFVNRNHYAGLLAMALSLAVAECIVILQTVPQRHSGSTAIQLCLLMVSASLILLGILYSLSRMGFVSVMCSWYLIGLMLLRGYLPLKKQLAVLGLPLFLLAGLLLLSTSELRARFTEFTSLDKLKNDGRLALWAEAWDLFRDYPVVGCGLGSLENASLRPSPMLRRVHHAHNDYLQLLVELGILGFPIFAALAWTVFANGLIGMTSLNPKVRSLALGCTAAMGGLFLHSCVDFQLYVPANVFVLMWISGIASNLGSFRVVTTQETLPKANRLQHPRRSILNSIRAAKYPEFLRDY
jgi:O-antigen ligase